MNDFNKLIESIQKGDQGQVSALLAQEADLSQARTPQGLSLIMLAAYSNQPEIAKLLAGYTPALDIYEASALGDLGAVQKLAALDPGLVNTFALDGFQPLGLACFFGHTQVAAYLLSMGAQVDQASRNPLQVMPLHSAVAARNMEIVRLLLAAGAPVNATQADAFTPLHGAAQNGQLEMIKLLVDYGADPELRAGDGKTPYDLALEAGYTQAADLLKELM